jgi:ABC-type lipoprotein release transport system permease subunit
MNRRDLWLRIRALLAGVLVIVTSCVLAVSVPALRAARIDPMATLRKD